MDDNLNKIRELKVDELQLINGGFHLNLGTAVAAIAVGLVTGGPAGVGIALCGLVVNEGVNNLNDLAQQ